jgi:hypothetical protein
MKNVISAKDIEDLLARGGSVSSLPNDAILTPSAKDLLRDLQRRSGGMVAQPAPPGAYSSNGTQAPPPKQLNSKSPKAELEALFNSAYCQNLK